MSRNFKALVAIAVLALVSSVAAAAVVWTPPPTAPAGDYVGTFDFDSGPNDSPFGNYTVRTLTKGTLKFQDNDPSLDPAKILLLDQGVGEADANNRVTIDAQGNIIAVATM